MLMLSTQAAAAIAALCRRHACEPIARVRSIAAGPRPQVGVEPGADPAARDITVSRDGVTVLIDRELAPATADKILHAEPLDGPATAEFVLHDQPGEHSDS